MATGEEEMAWFMDTYSQQVGHSVPEIVTGKPPVLGGTLVRREATGLGVVYVIEAALARRQMPLAGRTVVIQGFGNVGATVAVELHRRGGVVVGVSDHTGGCAAPEGLDIPAIVEWVAAHHFLEGCPHGDPVGSAEVLELPCDIVVPAALERQITDENAPRLQCRMVVEAANGPTTPPAEAVLQHRGIEVVPDVLANAGGVTVSYFEWVQDVQRYLWNDDDMRARLRQLLSVAFARVSAGAQRHGTDLRTAVLIEAVDRVATAARVRGIYP
jgi:glutamate dehydrogenase (NAD(P)+)